MMWGAKGKWISSIKASERSIVFKDMGFYNKDENSQSFQWVIILPRLMRITPAIGSLWLFRSKLSLVTLHPDVRNTFINKIQKVLAKLASISKTKTKHRKLKHHNGNWLADRCPLGKILKNHKVCAITSLGWYLVRSSANWLTRILLVKIYLRNRIHIWIFYVTL